MTESPTIHHRSTLRCRLGTAVVCPDLEPHQRGSSGGLLGRAAGRHRPVAARGGRSPPSCQPHPPLCSASTAITGSPHPLTPAQAAHRLLMQWRLARTGSLCCVLRLPRENGGRAGGSRRKAELSPSRTAFRRKGGAERDPPFC